MAFDFEAVPFPVTPFQSQSAAETKRFVVYPRPDSETDNGGDPVARHRWAHPDMDYWIGPMQVRLGRFPYVMAIDTANTHPDLIGNITVGENYNDADAYEVRIHQATIATLSTGVDYGIQLKVTDNGGAELRVWWSFRIEANDLDKFFFVDNSGANGDGSFATPFDNISEPLWLEGGNGGNAAGKTLVIKEGNSQSGTPYLKTAAWNASTIAFPSSIINIPGEIPKVNCQSQQPLFGMNGASDMLVKGIYALNGAVTNSKDSYGAFVNGWRVNCNRIAILQNIFDGVNFWPTSATNNGMITTDGNSASIFREHFAISGNTFKNTVGCSVGWNAATIVLMHWKYGLIDNNTAENIGTTGAGVESLVYYKHAITEITTRRWTAIDNINVRFEFLEGNATSALNGYNSNYMEYCYNNCESTYNGIDMMTIPGTIGASGTDGPAYIYKNTFIGGRMFIENVAAGDFDYFANISTLAKHTSNTTGTVTVTDDFDDVVSGDLLADNTLTDAYLSSKGYSRGELGHEIVVSGAGGIAASYIAPTTNVYDLTATGGTQEISAGYIAPTATLYPPYVSNTVPTRNVIDLPFISTATLYPLTVTPTNLTQGMEFIQSSANVFEINVIGAEGRAGEEDDSSETLIYAHYEALKLAMYEYYNIKN